MDNSSQDIAERVKQRINNFKRSSVTEGKPCEVVMPAARSDVTLGDTIKHSSTWAALAGAAVGAMLSYGPQLLAFIPGPIGIGARIGMFLFNVADAGTAIASEKSLSERAADTVSEWIESFSADSHGKLVKGADSVLINNLPAAFATPPKGVNQSVKCDDHTLQEISQGSETVYIEGAPVARKGDKTSCGATISSGSPNVFFGSGQTTTQDIALETAEVINIISSVVNVGLMIRNFAQIAKNIKCAITAFKDNKGVNRYIQSGAKLVDGDPIDVLSGQVVEQRTDFILGQTIPLSFTRTWARSKETDFTDGLCGRYWADNFSEYVKVSANGQNIQIATTEGTFLRFALPLGYMQSFNPDHPQFTLNRHRDYLELFDRETRLSKFFQISTARFAENKDELGFPPLEDGIFPINHWQDEFANRVDFIYQDNRLTQIKHSDGIELTLAYQGQWLHQIIRTDTEQSEILVTYRQDEQGALIENNALLDFHLFYDYDDKFNLIRWSDRDKTWVDYHYDEQGRVIHSIGADGFYPVWFQYEENRTTVLDSQQRATVYDYNSHLMKPLTITSPSGAKTHFDYDRYGNLLTQTLPDGNQITFDYLEQTGLVRCFTNTLGNQWQYEYDDREELIKLTDPLNRTWTRQIQLAEVKNGEKQTALFTAPDGTTTEFIRNQYGLLTEVKSTLGKHQQIEQFHYDPQHRLIETQDSEQRRIQLGYDDKDRLSRFTNGRGYQWQYGYNAQHKLSRINRPNQSLEQQDYDRHGNLIRYTDANGVDWQLKYGAFDLLIEKIDGEGNRWQYDYDKDSLKLNKVTNPKGETYTYTFNENGQVATETDFADNCWVYTYNENDTLKSLTDGEGNVTHYEYDPGYHLTRLITADDSYFYEYDKLGRITAIQSLYSRQTFDYDLNDRIIKETQNGNRIERTYDDENQTLTRTLYVEGKDEPIITQFKYNNLGELIELNLPDTSGQKHALFFQYDQNGNETDRTCPQGFILKQTYDAMDCLTQQRAGWEPTQFFDKDELRATGIDEPSFAEVNQHYRYDKALNTLETKDKGEQLYFTLNRNNQITQVHNQNREQERYAYDECGYLTQRYVGSETYGLIQNPHHPEFHTQRQIVQHQGIYQKGHKLHRLNENYYEYDKAGRLVTKVEKRDGFRKQETHYRWNGKNELIGITTPKGEVWHYKYDALGRRIAKECPQQHLRIEYLWDGDQLAYTRTFKNDELVSERHSIFNGFELIAQQDNYKTLKQTIDGNIVEWKQETGYAICQPNGQVLALLNPQGKTLWRKEKRSLWGVSFSDYHRNSQLDPNLLFAGQWLDEESGLAYNRFRYYDPESGNYISGDPIGLQGGEIPYSYAFNPVDWCDVFGLKSHAVQLKNNMKLYDGKDFAYNPLYSHDAKTAHHIVQENRNNSYVNKSKDILTRNGIDYRTNPANGASLWGTGKNQILHPSYPSNPNLIHSGYIHSNASDKRILRLLERAERSGKPNAVENTLRSIGNKMEAGRWISKCK